MARSTHCRECPRHLPAPAFAIGLHGRRRVARRCEGKSNPRVGKRVSWRFKCTPSRASCARESQSTTFCPRILLCSSAGDSPAGLLPPFSPVNPWATVGWPQQLLHGQWPLPPGRLTLPPSNRRPPRKPPATSLALSSDYGVSVKTIRDIWNR